MFEFFFFFSQTKSSSVNDHNKKWIIPQAGIPTANAIIDERNFEKTVFGARVQQMRT